MAVGKQRYLVAYDIVDDCRRSRVAKVLQTCGERLQCSVFLLEVRPSRIIRIRQSLEMEMESGEDSIVICSLGPADSEGKGMTFLGRRAYEDVVSPTVI